MLKGISAQRRSRIFAATDGGHNRRKTARYGAQATVAPHAQKNDPMPLANQTDSLCQRTRPVTGFGSDSNLLKKPAAFIITDLTPVVHWHTTASDTTRHTANNMPFATFETHMKVEVVAEEKPHGQHDP